MALYDSIDLDFTWDGDYQIGESGDIKDTSSDLILSLKNELHTIVKSESNDWELHPNLGVNASDFRGEGNTREMGKAMEDRYRLKLIAAGIVKPEDIQVKVIPVGKHQVMVTLYVKVLATAGNGLAIGEPLAITLLYDSLEDSIFFLEESRNLRNSRTF